VSILPNVSKILALMYTDVMTVSRLPENAGIDENGAVIVNAEPEIIYAGIPCRLSLGAKDTPDMSDDANPAEVRPVIICRPNIRLASGDFVRVLRNGEIIYSGHIGRPNPYGSSIQVQFLDKENS